MTASEPTRTEIGRGIAAIVLVLALIVAAVYGAIVALDHLRSGVAAAVVTASATVLIAVFTFVASQRADQRRLIEQSVREKKLPLYDHWMRFLFETNQIVGDLTDDEITQKIMEFNRESLHTLVLWVSEPVLAAYNEIQKIVIANVASGAEPAPNLLFAFEDVLLAVRKDLGHSNQGVKRGDLLRLWVSDIDTVLMPSAPQ